MRITVTRKPSQLASVRLTGPGSLVEGESAQYTASAVDQYGKPFPFSAAGWRSSNPAVLTVTPAGVVTAVAEGEAELVVLDGEGRAYP